MEHLGFEPRPAELQSDMHPDYTNVPMVGLGGFEPPSLVPKTSRIDQTTLQSYKQAYRDLNPNFMLSSSRLFLPTM